MNKLSPPLLQQVFASRLSNWLVVLFAIVARAIQLVFFFNIRSDGSFQFLATQNLVQGKGLSIAASKIQDLASVDYLPVVQWPPGFSVIVAPFYVLFNNYIVAGIALQFLAALLLIFTSRGILKLLEVPTATVNLFTIVTSFYIYPFYFLCCSDAIATSFFFLGFYQALLAMKHNVAGFSKCFWLCLGLFMAAFIKYLFIPVVFVVPAFLYIKGRINNQQQISKLGIISFRVIAFAIAITLFYQKFAGGSATYISEPARGFFPQNLEVLYPFFPSSVIQPSTLAMFLSSQKNVFDIYRLLHIVALLVVTGFFIKYILRRGFHNISQRTGFIYLAFFVSLVVSLLLASLSLIVAKENQATSPWTYVEEARYYGVVLVLVHLTIFCFVDSARNKTVRRLLLLLILLLCIESARGIIFTTKRIILLKSEEYSWQYEFRFQKYADDILSRQKLKHKTQYAVVAGSSYIMNHRIALYSHVPVMYDLATLNQLPSIPASEPTILLIVLYKDQMSLYKSFINEKSSQLVGQFDGFYFYSVYVAAD